MAHFYKTVNGAGVANVLISANGYGSMKGLQPEQIDEIIDTLIRSNYSDDDIKKILGNNFLRVASKSLEIKL